WGGANPRGRGAKPGDRARPPAALAVDAPYAVLRPDCGYRGVGILAPTRATLRSSWFLPPGRVTEEAALVPAAVALGLASGEALIGIWVATQAVSLVRPFVRRPRSAVP